MLYYPSNLSKHATSKARLKLYGILLSGGECLCCGRTGLVGAIDQHHVDSNTKNEWLTSRHAKERGDYTRSMVNALTVYEYLREIEKCVPVCRCCHSEIEAGFVESPSILQWSTQRCSCCGKSYRCSNRSEVDQCWDCFKITERLEQTHERVSIFR